MTLYTVLDFETASACDLKACGADRYAEDPTTEILCLTYTAGHERVFSWQPGDPQKTELTLRSMVDDGYLFVAHNAGFEQAIWRHIMVPQFGFPEIPIARWHDTMAVAAMKALPQQLERMAVVMRLPVTKDMEGRRITLALSKPDRKGYYQVRTPVLVQRVIRYCAADTSTELAAHRRLGWLPPNERKTWELDQVMNQRGIRLDMDFVRKCQRIVDDGSRPLMAEFKSLTGVNVGQRDKFLEWCREQGTVVASLQKDYLAKLLGPADEHGNDDDNGDPVDDEDADPRPELPDTVRRALSIRQLVGSASIKKLRRMERCVSHDGRARGLLQYHGTGPGRWAGRLLQPQNFPRPTMMVDDGLVPIDSLVQAIMTGDAEYVAAVIGPPVETVVSSLRHTIIANPGRSLVSGDYAGIQACIVLALAGQHDKCDLMRHGGSNAAYCDMAASIYGHPVNKKEHPEKRQIGKNTVLGLGFQMGKDKFHNKYCPLQPIDFAEQVVYAYRRDWAPQVPKLWYGLENAAVRTVWDGTPHEAFGCRYEMEDGALVVTVPTGGRIWYQNVERVRKAMPWDPMDIRLGFTYQAMKMGQWRTIHAFGGLLTENVVMRIEQDMMVTAGLKLEVNGFPLVLTCHDEWLSEPREQDADVAAFEQIMLDVEPAVKALGVPVAVECWVGDRYRK